MFKAARVLDTWVYIYTLKVSSIKWVLQSYLFCVCYPIFVYFYYFTEFKIFLLIV